MVMDRDIIGAKNIEMSHSNWPISRAFLTPPPHWLSLSERAQNLNTHATRRPLWFPAENTGTRTFLVFLVVRRGNFFFAFRKKKAHQTQQTDRVSKG
ncbi:MAG: hypothetical protein Q8P67_18800 [archaeon]|nr:hypothetical protein [archaeon]